MTIIDTAIPDVDETERDVRFARATRAWGERLDADLANATIGVRASGRAAGAVATRVRAGRHEFVIDEPLALAGDDAGPSPVEYALGALIGCQVVVYRLYASRLGIEVDDIEITASGTLDVRGLFGVDEQVRPGFQGIELDVRVTGPEPRERYQALLDEVDRHCPVLDLFQHATPVSSRLVG